MTVDQMGSKADAITNARRLLNARDYQAAVEQAEEILSGDPECAAAYRLLGFASRKLGNIDKARAAERRAIDLASLHPDIFQATLAIAENRLDGAERLLRPYLKDQPDDPAALRLLAEIAARLARYNDAEKLVQSALTVAPEFERALSLLKEIQGHRSTDGKLPSYAFPTGRSDTIDAIEQYSEALELYHRVVTRYPNSPENWVSYGHILRTVGEQDQAIAAYRKAIEVRPSTGEAWWAIADLKTHALTNDDISQLHQLITDAATSDRDLPSLCFALGRGLELNNSPEQAFQNYAKGNRLRRKEVEHDREAVTRHVDASIALFDKPFFELRQGAGFNTPDPIFILGMPRAGSTLIEQILSTHAEVEGTMELPNIGGIANWLAEGKEAAFEDSQYLDRLAALPAAELEKLGKGYIWGTGLRRQTSRKLFIDKMPNNWLHLGMILSILPNAKIIDARRHPMACGLSIYRQHFARGQAFSYDLTDIGSFYANYVRMMDHFDELFPGRVIRVFHERLVTNPEEEIRSLLAQLGLPFDEGCLKFHENRRAVRTSSSEQVRQPIKTDALEQWRGFHPWLGELSEALGSAAAYPGRGQ